MSDFAESDCRVFAQRRAMHIPRLHGTHETGVTVRAGT